MEELASGRPDVSSQRRQSLPRKLGTSSGSLASRVPDRILVGSLALAQDPWLLITPLAPYRGSSRWRPGQKGGAVGPKPILSRSRCPTAQRTRRLLVGDDYTHPLVITNTHTSHSGKHVPCVKPVFGMCCEAKVRQAFVEEDS